MRENEPSADNQQERFVQAGWIAGFVDGEGYFGVNLCRNTTMRFGYQIQPEFVVTQSANSIKSLQFIKNYFGCGYIVLNKRKDNHRCDIAHYRVRSLRELKTIILPFFKRYSLKTAKKCDFHLFTKIVKKMSKKEHLTNNGFKAIIDELGYKLDQKSSETIRQA